jgi:hypothetical protein
MGGKRTLAELAFFDAIIDDMFGDREPACELRMSQSASWLEEWSTGATATNETK